MCNIFIDYKFDNLAFFMTIVLFSNILGPSFYYGVDIIIIFLAAYIQKGYQEDQDDEDYD